MSVQTYLMNTGLLDKSFCRATTKKTSSKVFLDGFFRRHCGAFGQRHKNLGQRTKLSGKDNLVLEPPFRWAKPSDITCHFSPFRAKTLLDEFHLALRFLSLHKGFQ